MPELKILVADKLVHKPKHVCILEDNIHSNAHSKTLFQRCYPVPSSFFSSPPVFIQIVPLNVLSFFSHFCTCGDAVFVPSILLPFCRYLFLITTFPVVTNARTRSSGHKLEHQRLPLNTRLHSCAVWWWSTGRGWPKAMGLLGDWLAWTRVLRVSLVE